MKIRMCSRRGRQKQRDIGTRSGSSIAKKSRINMVLVSRSQIRKVSVAL